MANLDAEKLKEKLSQIVVNVLEAQEKAVVTGILDLQGDIIERVFQNGQDVDGNQIGNYSTKPLYVSITGQTSQVRKSSLKPRGKNSTDSEFKNGKPRKSQYFPDGYNGYRSTVGRPTDRVNLFLTGSLQGSILPGTTNGNPSLSIATDDELKKADGNEQRFGKVIFAPSEEELNRITTKWQDDTTEAFFDSFEP